MGRPVIAVKGADKEFSAPDSAVVPKAGTVHRDAYRFFHAAVFSHTRGNVGVVMLHFYNRHTHIFSKFG